MTNRAILLTALICSVTGLALIASGSSMGLSDRAARVLTNALVVVPPAIAVSITTWRHRHARREDDANSLEYQARRDAAVRALGDALVLASLLVLALAALPTTAPVAWAIVFLVLLVLDFWGRYAWAVRSLRG